MQRGDLKTGISCAKRAAYAKAPRRRVRNRYGEDLCKFLEAEHRVWGNTRPQKGMRGRRVSGIPTYEEYL